MKLYVFGMSYNKPNGFILSKMSGVCVCAGVCVCVGGWHIFDIGSQ